MTRRERDPAVDVLRAVAIVGVVVGHWLVTAIVLRPDGSLGTASPLAAMGWFAPVTWLLQTLGLFFFVAGYAAARSRATSSAPGRVRGRMRRLLLPLAGFAGAYVVLLGVAAAAGVPFATLRTVAKLAASPLWFLGVLVVLGVLTRPLVRLVDRRGGTLAVVAAGALAVAAGDVALGYGFGQGWPVVLVAAWAVPYALGLALGRDRLPTGRWFGWALLAGGASAVAALVVLAGYPGSAVGVPGGARSNLNPPSLATVALAVAQAGAALLVRPHVSVRGRVVGWVNRHAMPVYLWHQTALVAVTALALWLAGRPLPGLHTAPAGPQWVGARLLWLPAVAAALWLGVRLTAGTTARTDHRPREGAGKNPAGSRPGTPLGR